MQACGSFLCGGGPIHTPSDKARFQNETMNVGKDFNEAYVHVDSFNAHPADRRQPKVVQKKCCRRAHGAVATIYGVGDEKNQAKNHCHAQIDENFTRSFFSQLSKACFLTRLETTNCTLLLLYR